MGLAGVLLGTAVHAQDADAVLGSSGGWQRYDWLAPTDGASVAGGKVATTVGQNVGDPFAVASGALWQENYGVTYSRPLAPALTLSYETSEVTMNESSDSLTDGSPDDLSHAQKVGLQLQPVEQLTLNGDVHDSNDDAGSPDSATETRGTGLTAEGHLPFDSVLTLGARSDSTTIGTIGGTASADNAYDAQWKQPLGKLPLSAVLKGHYEETSQDGTLATRLPSLEQSLVWKPADTTTVQMGLRQQHYQDFPGITNQLNEIVFADWSQTILPEVTWHSYAEVLDSRTADIAPAAPATSGTNGTPQSDDPTNSLGLPTSFTDQTVTLSTGPTFRLQDDISASIEYSSRIDSNPLPGDVGQEQRVSVSLKGSF
jgi:hypothetical protein